MSPLPGLVKGVYRHTKTGHLYEVIGVALQTETDEPLVIYKPLWRCKYQLFARPYAMFVEHVEVNDATAPRFVLVEPR